MPDYASLRHEFRVSTGEKADLKPAITSFYMYFYVIPFFSPLKSGTRASLRHESVTTLKLMTDDASLRQVFLI